MSRRERAMSVEEPTLALNTQAGRDGAPAPTARSAKGPLARCHGCGLTWVTLGEAHCTASGCHAQFSSAGAFDRHLRVGGCIPPAEVRNRKTDKPALESFERDGRTVWRAYADPDKPPPSHWQGKR